MLREGSEFLTQLKSIQPKTQPSYYKDVLNRLTKHIQQAHNQGAGGREICHARTGVVDLILRHAAETAFAEEFKQAVHEVFAAVALGGYGRSELSPHSDVDVLLLLGNSAPTAIRVFVSTKLFPGGWFDELFARSRLLIRDVETCLRTANVDLRFKTSLVESRFLCGDPLLYKRLQQRLITECIDGQEEAYISELIKDWHARRAHHGNTPFVQEPNVKQGCGGLRDYHSLVWMAFFRHRTKTLAELCERRLVSPADLQALESAYDFMLRLRNELHFRCGRTYDVLSKSLQPQVASAIGFRQSTPGERVEQLMSAYYRHARTMYEVSGMLMDVTAQPCASTGPPRRTEHKDGFLLRDGALLPAHEGIFDEQPSQLMRAFLLAQKHGWRLPPETLRLIRDSVPRLDWNNLRNCAWAKGMLLELLRMPGRVAPVLRQMHEAGLLARLVPAFAHLTGMVQHEFFHQYTADEHTLVCLEKLDAIANELLPDCGLYTELFHQLPRPELLYLALLLHDTGKGEGRDHAENGACIAAAETRRLGLASADAARVVFLVRHHLGMVVISQKRDLDDPEVIRGFAELVGDTENLRMLTLHTLADSLGTSDCLWNAYKDQLLRMLYTRTLQHLTGVSTPTGAARREALRESLRHCPPPHLALDEIEAHFTSLPDNYFSHLSPEELLADLQVAHEFLALQVHGQAPALAPAIHIRNQPERSDTVIRVCTWDHSGLFARLAASLSAAGLNILHAEIYTRSDHLVLDRFHVVDPRTGTPASEAALEKFRTLAFKALSGELELAELLRPDGQQSEPLPRREPVSPRITFDNQASATRTVLEIQAEDRPGLLAALAATLAELGVDVSLAKINTSHGIAEDVFYVTDADGRQILSPERQEQIRLRLLEAIATPG